MPVKYQSKQFDSTVSEGYICIHQFQYHTSVLFTFLSSHQHHIHISHRDKILNNCKSEHITNEYIVLYTVQTQIMETTNYFQNDWGWQLHCPFFLTQTLYLLNSLLIKTLYT